MVEGKGFVGHASNNRALLQHTRVQNAAEHGTPRNQAQPGFCRCSAGEALLCGPRRRSPGRGSRPSTHSWLGKGGRDRKSTRLNSSHGYISYAVFCLKKKKKKTSEPVRAHC